MNSDQQNSKVCDNFRGVRAGPRRRDELGPGEMKIVTFSEGSELVTGEEMNSDHTCSVARKSRGRLVKRSKQGARDKLRCCTDSCLYLQDALGGAHTQTEKSSIYPRSHSPAESDPPQSLHT